MPNRNPIDIVMRKLTVLLGRDTRYTAQPHEGCFRISAKARDGSYKMVKLPIEDLHAARTHRSVSYEDLAIRLAKQLQELI